MVSIYGANSGEFSKRYGYICWKFKMFYFKLVINEENLDALLF